MHIEIYLQHYERRFLQRSIANCKASKSRFACFGSSSENQIDVIKTDERKGGFSGLALEPNSGALPALLKDFLQQHCTELSTGFQLVLFADRILLYLEMNYVNHRKCVML